jgi:hypothetical protein
VTGNRADLELDWNLSHWRGPYLMVDVWAGSDHVGELWLDETAIDGLSEELKAHARLGE